MRSAPASAPLCATAATAGRPAIGSAAMVSNVSATPSAKLVKPMQFGPSTRTRPSRAVWRSRSCSVAARLVHLGKARREHDGAADAAPPAGRDRLDHALLRHHQHGGVDALGQVVDRRRRRRGR